MNMLWMERHHLATALDPVADAFSGTVTTPVVSMAGGKSVVFLVHKGAGATGTSTITVEACDDTVPSNTEAVPFAYRRCANTADVQGSIIHATASGFTTTAGASELYAVEVEIGHVIHTDKRYVRLKAVEVVDSPVLGYVGILRVERQS